MRKEMELNKIPLALYCLCRFTTTFIDLVAADKEKRKKMGRFPRSHDTLFTTVIRHVSFEAIEKLVINVAICPGCLHRLISPWSTAMPVIGNEKQFQHNRCCLCSLSLSRPLNQRHRGSLEYPPNHLQNQFRELSPPQLCFSSILLLRRTTCEVQRCMSQGGNIWGRMERIICQMAVQLHVSQDIYLL